MFRLKVTRLKDSLVPHQVTVSIQTLEGEVHIVVHEHSLRKDFGSDTIGVCDPVSQKTGGWRVELPAATVDGKWHVCVRAEELGPKPHVKPVVVLPAVHVHA